MNGEAWYESNLTLLLEIRSGSLDYSTEQLLGKFTSVLTVEVKVRDRDRG